MRSIQILDDQVLAVVISLANKLLGRACHIKKRTIVTSARLHKIKKITINRVSEEEEESCAAVISELVDIRLLQIVQDQ
jgi:hypothetical protein